ETFLDVYNKYPQSPKAPEALMRLGQSLAALGKQEAARAPLGAALQKNPKASAQGKKTGQAGTKSVRWWGPARRHPPATPGARFRRASSRRCFSILPISAV